MTPNEPLGWTVVPNDLLKWHVRLRIRLWFNRLLGKHTIASWDLKDD